MSSISVLKKCALCVALVGSSVLFVGCAEEKKEVKKSGTSTTSTTSASSTTTPTTSSTSTTSGTSTATATATTTAH